MALQTNHLAGAAFAIASLLALAGCTAPEPSTPALDLGEPFHELPDGAGIYAAKIIEGRLVVDGEPGPWGETASATVDRTWVLEKDSFDDGGGVTRDLWDDVNATLEVRLRQDVAVGDLSAAWSFIETLEELQAFVTGGGACDAVTPAIDARTQPGDVAQYRLPGPGIVGVGVQLFDGDQRVALFCNLWEGVVAFHGVVESAVHPNTAPPRSNAIDEFPFSFAMGYPAHGQLTQITAFSVSTRLESMPPAEGHHAGLQVTQDGDAVCTKTEPEDPASLDWASHACVAGGTGATSVRVGAIPGPTYANAGPVRYTLDLSLTAALYEEPSN